MDALILAGGENRRFLSHKALAELQGRRIIEATAALFSNHFGRVFISTNSPELFFYLGLPLLGDLLPHRGPMTGIYSSLIGTGADALFVAACDMPSLQAEVIELLLRRYRGQQVLLPVFEGRPQPLFGIYGSSVKAAMGEHIGRNSRSMRVLLRSLKPSFVEEAAVRRADPEGRTFININTPEEYRRLVEAQNL